MRKDEVKRMNEWRKEIEEAKTGMYHRLGEATIQLDGLDGVWLLVDGLGKEQWFDHVPTKEDKKTFHGYTV